MKTTLTILLLMAATASFAQWSPTIDTVTSGDFDDLSPQVDHAGIGMTFVGLSSAPVTEEWLVFERWENRMSSIAAVKFLGNQLKWDPSVTIISPAKPGVVQKYPDVCTAQNHISVAAWQQKTDTVWSICYSVCDSSGGDWSAPSALTNDSVSSTNVKVRTLTDSSFILIWREATSILFSTFNTGHLSEPETLAVSDFDSTDYDFYSSGSYGSNQFVWTRIGDSGNGFCLLSNVEDLSSPSLSSPDTISCSGDMSNPRFMSSGGGPFAFDLKQGEKYEAWQVSMNGVPRWMPEELAGDANSSYRNAVFFVPPLFTGIQPALRKTGEIVPFGYYAWEKQTSTDTSIVFFGARDDSLEPGSNPSISPLSFYEGNKTSQGFVVWESNQTGRFHIYGRDYTWVQTNVNEANGPASDFELGQNYPNPFNPTTVISYRLSAVSNVTLKVYDVLGRLLETLADGRQILGEHSVTFDGRELSSGVYFYKLSANGENIQVRKMILLK